MKLLGEMADHQKPREDDRVDVVENQHHGNVNKFLGDGFMALFGIGEQQADHNSNAAASPTDRKWQGQR